MRRDAEDSLDRAWSRLAGEVLLYDQEAPNKEIEDAGAHPFAPTSPTHWRRTPERQDNAPAHDDLPGDEESQGADPASGRVVPEGEGQFVQYDGHREALKLEAQWTLLARQALPTPLETEEEPYLDEPLHNVRSARRFNIEVGQPIWYGKYKNKKGTIIGFKDDPKGDTIVVIKQIPDPTGRKKPKELKLFKIRPRIVEEEEEGEGEEGEGKTASEVWESARLGLSDGTYLDVEIAAVESVGKTAATLSELVARTSQVVRDRAKEIRIRLARADPRRGIWLFDAYGKTGNYTVKIKGIRKGNVKALSKAQVKVTCSCPFWRWQGPEHWGKMNGYLYEKPRGTATEPVVMDKPGKHWVCKHVLAAIELARKYRFGSEADNWLQGDVEILAMSPDEGLDWDG